MALSFVAQATAGSALPADGTVTVSKPTGTTNGDVMFAFITTNADGTLSTPSGWTLISTMQIRTGELSGCYYRVASSEPAEYTFTDTGSTMGAGIITLRGQNTTVIDVAAVVGTQVTSGTSIVADSVTTATDGAWLVCWYGGRGVNTYSQPTGMTERYDFADGLTTYSQAVDTQEIALAGATGTRTTTTSGAISLGARAISFGVRPAASAPAAPTLGTITPGNAQLSAAFTAGGSGGSAITTYKYSTDNGVSYLTRQTGTTASPIVITTLSSDGTTPLVNGTPYTVLIKAVNAIGDGAASNAVAATPATTPSAPTSLVATGGDAQVSVAFTAGATGGSAITTYKYSTDNGSTYLTRQTGTTASPVVITTLSSDGTTPLVNGVTYQIKLKAVNAIGDGAASSAVSGTPDAPGTPPNLLMLGVG